VSSLICAHCQACQPERGPLARNGNEFVTCPECGHDRDTGESFESWKSRPSIELSDEDEYPLAFDDFDKDAHETTSPGKKHDQGKPQWDLVPWAAQGEVVEVLTFGADKYGPENWRQVDNSRRRYFAAALRHTIAWFKGEKRDPESGLHHLAHAICCLLFLLEKELGETDEHESKLQ